MSSSLVPLVLFGTHRKPSRSPRGALLLFCFFLDDLLSLILFGEPLYLILFGHPSVFSIFWSGLLDSWTAFWIASFLGGLLDCSFLNGLLDCLFLGRPFRLLFLEGPFGSLYSWTAVWIALFFSCRF